MSAEATRLDVWLTRHAGVRSRSRARQLIEAGAVSVDGSVVCRASVTVSASARVTVDDDGWVSRAAGKLLFALDASGTRVGGRALDVGASTGGFTQVLLARGCEVVHAVDVGHDQLAQLLRDDPRVVSWEGLHAKDLKLCHVGGAPVDVATVDVSFIPLGHVLPHMLPLVQPDGVVIALVKPQFEVGRQALGRGGIVRDDAARERALTDVVEEMAAAGWDAEWTGEAGVAGEHGNREWAVVWRRRRPQGLGCHP